jgi:hypothetical protein
MDKLQASNHTMPLVPEPSGSHAAASTAAHAHTGNPALLGPPSSSPSACPLAARGSAVFVVDLSRLDHQCLKVPTVQQASNQAQQQPQAADNSPQLSTGCGRSSCCCCCWPSRVCQAVACAAFILACVGLALGIVYTVKNAQGTLTSL